MPGEKKLLYSSTKLEENVTTNQISITLFHNYKNIKLYKLYLQIAKTRVEP